jgi:hypothetical protein
MSANTVLSKVNRLSDRHEEYRAEGAITPGHIVKVTATGGVLVHAPAGAAAEVIIACEDDMQGRTWDTPYAATELVQAHHAQRGDEWSGFLANGQSVANGQALSSDGAGGLKAASGTDAIIAVAAETKANTSGAQARILARCATGGGAGTTTTTTTTT